LVGAPCRRRRSEAGEKLACLLRVERDVHPGLFLRSEDAPLAVSLDLAAVAGEREPIDPPIGAARLRPELQATEVATVGHERVRDDVELGPGVCGCVARGLGPTRPRVGGQARRDLALPRQPESNQARDDAAGRDLRGRRDPRRGSVELRAAQIQAPAGGRALRGDIEIAQANAERIELTRREPTPRARGWRPLRL
jgi:hypothetical protein